MFFYLRIENMPEENRSLYSLLSKGIKTILSPVDDCIITYWIVIL
jgi:hypothetical protein